MGDKVLKPVWQKRLKEEPNLAKAPMFIVTPEEATKNEESKSKGN